MTAPARTVTARARTFADSAFDFRDERAADMLALFGDKDITDEIAEGIGAGEATSQDCLVVTERMGIGERGQVLATVLREGLSLQESIVSRADLCDGFGLADEMETRTNRIDLCDGFGLADEMETRTNRIDLRDGFALADGMVRSSGAVLSDLGVRSTLTAKEFAALAERPIGYDPFRLFHVGDYEYQNALVRVTIAAASLGAAAQIYDMAMNVDIDDTVSRGRASLVAGDNFVSYGKPYYTRPEVTATLRGGYGADGKASVVVDSIDNTGFHVRLVKSDGTNAAGVISWTAVGY